jgi:glutamate-5-semialdehyde dehydrogenase
MNNYLETFQAVKDASSQLKMLSHQKVNLVLQKLAQILRDESNEIIFENQKDLQRMEESNPKYDRLLLNHERIQSIAQDIEQVIDLPCPLDKILEQKTLPNGLHLQKKSVPLGVIGVIYEARPNVTIDVFCLALKSGNGLLLKGGSDAEFSIQALMLRIHRALKHFDLPKSTFQLLPSNRKATKALLEAVGYVDLVIPRGSQALIDFVRENAKVPIIETGAGIVHTYLDESADLSKSIPVILNAKTRRVSVCNALDCLIVNENILEHLVDILTPLLEKGIEIYADAQAYQSLTPLKSQNIHLATIEHFGTEFLSKKMSIKTVKNIEEAVKHIQKYSSKHSEAILSEKATHIEYFLNHVDAAVVYVNTSTAFTDGNQFGLGSEIGISTQKLHARGPMGLNELTTYQWVVIGNGQIRG